MLRRNHVTKEQWHRKQYARRKRAAHMIGDGATVEAVCRELGYSVYRLRDICKEFGLPSMAKVAREKRHRGIVDALKRGCGREQCDDDGCAAPSSGRVAGKITAVAGD